ncbi:MAG TPA: hypothetical protein PKI12_06640 [Bacteroidales bacterium]|nr:hypothetical protein [Bacteroidales bacterium]
MARLIIIILCSVAVQGIFAQERGVPAGRRPSNTISVNLLGDGSNVSLNYEKLFRLNDFLFFTARAGAGYGRQLTLGNDSLNLPVYLAIPVHVTINAGKGRHFAELGMGNTLNSGNVDPHYLYFLIYGYRFYPLNRNNISIRIFGNLLLNKKDDYHNLYFVPFGFSLGYVF